MLRDFLDNESLLVGPRPPAEKACGGKTEYVYTQGSVKLGEAYRDLYVELEVNMVIDSLKQFTILSFAPILTADRMERLELRERHKNDV